MIQFEMGRRLLTFLQVKELLSLRMNSFLFPVAKALKGFLHSVGYDLPPESAQEFSGKKEPAEERER